MVQEKMDISSIPDDKRPESEIKKGGLRTMPFIIVNETFEKVASYGLLANMILYLKFDYNMTNVEGARVLFIWSATSNFLPVLGSFFSDSYMGRYRVIAFGSIISLLGMISLWSTALIPGARPRGCPSHVNCESPNSSQLSLLYTSFALMSIGAGGIRPCSLAFGADQLHHPDKQKKTMILQSFFNWYYASVGISLMVAVTVIVYIQDTAGWNLGFAIPAILMIISVVLFYLGSPLYVKMKADKSLFTGFAQVVAAAIKNRHVPPPSGDVYHYNKGNLMVPTSTLSSLNKACIMKSPGKDVNPEGSANDPWSLCTVQQVEDLKSLIKVMPIWSTGIMLAVLLSQQSFLILQANSMDRHLCPSFQIPAGSFSVFNILALTIWVAIYDRLLVPKLAKLTGNRRGLSLKQRMGIGLILCCIATAVSAVVEGHRRKRAIEQGFLNNGYAVVDMSALWLVPQYCILGLAEAFNIIGQIEFYYSELPKRMASIGVALFALGMGVGNLLAVVILGAVDDTSRKGGTESWVSNNINKGHYNYYYWVLTVLGGVNLLYFFVCSWSYGPCKEDEFGVLGKEDERDHEMTKSGHA
ncbi:protein NRT1/ PTR FAMILY 1.2-like [Aristolochia californica]|uniref:protein NRT1/ PTR FAMILY 1.2-like n=1 Tax=Aristolochia californica TaxID=171875 RepID=UPI0035DCF737